VNQRQAMAHDKLNGDHKGHAPLRRQCAGVCERDRSE
jgi:hypothetical protein